MTLRRIAKVFAAQNIGQLINVITQLLLPPVFLRVFGTSLYGQWITLSAAVSYLSTLNYGVQTYTNMQMTIHFNRGEVQECREVQSAGLRILLCAFIGWGLLLLAVFAMPVDRWLHLTVPQSSAQLALYFLGMQIMCGMIFGFFSGSYMVFGQAHRGTHMANANQLLGVLAMVTMVFLRMPFPIIAAAQVVVTLLLTAYLNFDLSHREPLIKPTLRYWKSGSLASILKPSAQYMLLASTTFLAYQVPIILMQRILGPAVVVVYSVTRTIYSMSRRLLYLLTNSLGPEVTLIYGQGDWRRLHRLYDLSERIVLLFVPPMTFGSMLATPLLLWIWLRKEQLFDPGLCIVLGLTVSVMAIKEHKYQFQFSSNKVAAISYLSVISYTIMILVAIPAMLEFGVLGFLWTWLICETIGLFILLRLNDQLFDREAVLDHSRIYRLFAVLAVGTAALYWPMYHIESLSLPMQGAVAVIVSLITAVICYWVFQADVVRDFLWQKLSGKFPNLAARQS